MGHQLRNEMREMGSEKWEVGSEKSEGIPAEFLHYNLTSHL